MQPRHQPPPRMRILLLRDAVNAALAVLAVHLWKERTRLRSAPGEQQAAGPCPAAASCAECNCPTGRNASCDCPECGGASAPGGCPECPSCGAQGTDTEQLLRLVDTFPPGFVAPTSPPVYIAVPNPALAFFSLQGELPVFELAAHLNKINSDGYWGSAGVVDVGGGHALGAFAVYAARLGRQTLAIEPTPQLLSSVVTSARLNALSHLVTAEYAFVFEPGLTVRDAGASVRSLSLDAAAARLRRVLIARIDAGGYEGLVLRSARKALLRRHQIAHVVVLARDPPEGTVSGLDARLRPWADLRHVFAALASGGWRGRLLASPCSRALGGQLESDSGSPVAAWHLPPASPALLPDLLRRRELRGAVCPVWLSRG
eukprot:TRINITY_DN66221_c0_g1_i1.p1 TRINITY_DN66221_c0_g1~~TRINITY_DN66221_c0_g1_i1.p1  ORF type:complete len:373 (+),score=77.45 TRINITY_DN66221_c0_g1_i1:125-1243(+)